MLTKLQRIFIYNHDITHAHECILYKKITQMNIRLTKISACSTFLMRFDDIIVLKLSTSVCHFSFLKIAFTEIIVNRRDRWFGNSLELQCKSLSMFLFWFMQK